MNTFKEFIEKYSINLYEVRSSSQYWTYVKWRQGVYKDPSLSSIRSFEQQFGDKYNFNRKELEDCFDGNEQVIEDHIVTISTDHMPRRNLSIIKHLITKKYANKKVLLINGTAYIDWFKDFGFKDNPTQKNFNRNMVYDCKISDLTPYIFETNNENIDIIDIDDAWGGEPMLVSEEEEGIAKHLRRLLIDLEQYDNILIACGMNRIYLKRILGAVSNTCCVLSDSHTKNTDVSEYKQHYTINGFNDKFIVLDTDEVNQNIYVHSHNDEYLDKVGIVFSQYLSSKLN